MRVPRTRYVDSGGCSIAYQVAGEGPLDLVFAQGLLSHLDMQWADPAFAQSLHRLAAISRMIIFDNRGVGLSDPVATVPTVAERVMDIERVMAAAGSERAVILGHCNGGPTAMTFAAMHPERTLKLVLSSTFAKGKPDSQCPGALSEDAFQQALNIWNRWGEGHSIKLFNPSRGDGVLYRKLYASFERAALSRGMARVAWLSTLDIDVTPVLGSIQAPTLVLHCTDDFLSIDAARWLAERIPNAEFVELSGGDHHPFAGVGSDIFIDVIERFVAESLPGATRDTPRFSTIMFTDIADSTDRLVAEGDAEWRRVMAHHDDVVREAIDSYDGECVKFTGDGHHATFDSPEQAVRCARHVIDTAITHSLRIRSAVHTGECQTLGREVVGLAVNIASRLGDVALPGEVLVSEPVTRLLAGTGLEFIPRGSQRLKGIPDPCSTYALVPESVDAPSPAAWRVRAEDVTKPKHLDQLFVEMSRRAPRVTRALATAASGRRHRAPASNHHRSAMPDVAGPR